MLKLITEFLTIDEALFITSLLIVGYPTYIKNTIDHNNPFFPLYDKNGEDIVKRSAFVSIIGYGGKGDGTGNQFDYEAETITDSFVEKLFTKKCKAVISW